MQNENNKKRFAGKGYYIALIACIAAVGISGYVFVKTAQDSAVEASAVVSPMPSEKAETETKTESTPSQSTGEETAAAETDEMGDSYEETMAEVDLGAAAMWPLEGDVVATFSQDTLTWSETMADWRTHEGLDIAAAQGDLVYAVQDGTVTAVYEDDYLGNVVVVSHAGDISTLYANLTETPSVVVGDTVAAGDVVGQVGNTALLETAEADHLHFEVFRNGVAADPLSYLPE